MKKPSQNDLILEVLADYQPHSFREIHARIGFCRLNSRISELRNPGGHRITCDKTGGDFKYQLLPPLEAASVRRGVAARVGAGAASSGAAGSGSLGNAGRGADGETQSQVVPLDDLHRESTGVQPGPLSLMPAAEAPDRSTGDSQLSLLEAAA